MEIKVKLINSTTRKVFYKYFKSEFERDKYIRRARYFKNIIILDECKEYDYE